MKFIRPLVAVILVIAMWNDSLIALRVLVTLLTVGYFVVTLEVMRLIYTAKKTLDEWGAELKSGGYVKP